MTSRRPPAVPPELPGYTFDRIIGSGGFSDVFLYEQSMPRRKVAVKVIRSAPGADQAEFVDEANLMAHVSSHPAIVTVYQADVAADGRPFLLMEYCAGPNLSQRYRSERLGVAEALRIGVRLAGAIETAHRAGILHRDIKPANVLTNDYGWPALTDFGISVMGAGAAETETGMSIPWAAPEFFADDQPRGARADIYSLAATLFTVLAGRSPFEVVGGSNAAFDLISRITREPPLPIGRQDVPASLENVLLRALDKRPGRRFATALDFGRALQRVELELHLAPTPIDVPDVRRVAESDPSTVVFGETQVRPVIEIDPSPAPSSAGWRPGAPFPGSPGVPAAPAAFAGVAGYPAPSAPGGEGGAGAPNRPDEAPQGPPLEQEVDPEGAEAPPRRPWLGIAVGGLVVAVAVTAVVLTNLGQGVEDPDPTPTTSAPIDGPATAGGLVVPQPVNVTAEREEGDPSVIVVTWEPPPGVDDATFVYRVLNSTDVAVPAGEPPLRLTDQPEESTCVVLQTRLEGALSQGWTECA